MSGHRQVDSWHIQIWLQAKIFTFQRSKASMLLRSSIVSKELALVL